MEKKCTALPVASLDEKMPTNVERFLKASGGEALMYFSSYASLTFFFVHALQWEEDDDSLLPDLEEFENFVLYANPKGLEYISQTAEHSNYRLQYRIMRKDGTLIWAIDRGVVTVDFHGNTQNQSIITEVSDIKEKEEELLKLAQSDPLTGLYNKTASTALATEILLQQRKGLHALMVLDIDNFKSINDSLGHALGDMVLTEVATRLRQLARPQDIVGRIGGDEFMLLITNIPEREVAQQKASDICSALRGNYICETGSCKLTCSLGVAFSEDECEFKALFINADAAMYRAKAKGRDQYLIYRKN